MMADFLIDKRIKVIYDDNSQSPVIKQGYCKFKDDDFLHILNEKNVLEILILSRVIRMEVLNDEFIK